MQAWYDPETANRQFIVYADKEMASGIKEDDFIRVDGKIAGTFTGENMLGGELTISAYSDNFDIELDDFVFEIE